MGWIDNVKKLLNDVFADTDMKITVYSLPPKKEEEYKKSLRNKGKKTAATRGRRKVFLIGDSHIKKMARIVQNISAEDLETFGVTKPGATMDEVINDVQNLTLELTPNDQLVIMGGANDISKLMKNREETPFTQEMIESIVSYAKTTNITIVSIPLRFDNTYNRTIKSINQEIKAKIKQAEMKIGDPTISDRINFLDVNRLIGKQHYSYDDKIHLNEMGKNLLAKAIVQSFEMTE